MTTRVANARSADVRAARKALKARVATGDVTAIEVLRDPPEEARAMRLETLLLAQHRWGHEQVWKTCSTARVSPYATLAGMCRAERRRVFVALGASPSGVREPDPATEERRRMLAEQVYGVVRRRHAEPLTLPMVAREVGWGATAVSAALATTGASFSEVLAGTRIAAAAVLLRRGGVTTEEVARRVGVSRSGLATGFRRRYGMTPSAYRLRHGSHASVTAPQSRVGPGADMKTVSTDVRYAICGCCADQPRSLRTSTS